MIASDYFDHAFPELQSDDTFNQRRQLWVAVIADPGDLNTRKAYLDYVRDLGEEHQDTPWGVAMVAHAESTAALAYLQANTHLTCGCMAIDTIRGVTGSECETCAMRRIHREAMARMGQVGQVPGHWQPVLAAAKRRGATTCAHVGNGAFESVLCTLDRWRQLGPITVVSHPIRYVEITPSAGIVRPVEGRKLVPIPNELRFGPNGLPKPGELVRSADGQVIGTAAEDDGYPVEMWVFTGFRYEISSALTDRFPAVEGFNNILGQHSLQEAKRLIATWLIMWARHAAGMSPLWSKVYAATDMGGHDPTQILRAANASELVRIQKAGGLAAVAAYNREVFGSEPQANPQEDPHPWEEQAEEEGEAE